MEVRQYVRMLPLKIDLDFPSFLSFFSTKEDNGVVRLVSCLGHKEQRGLTSSCTVISLLIHALANWLLIGRQNRKVKKSH
jgi:hypothetical protein